LNSGFRPSYAGFNAGVLTFRYDGLVEPGDLVTMYGSAAVRRAEDNEEFIGKVITVDSDFAAVQLVGYVECEADTKLQVGRVKLVSNGYGRVLESDDGIETWIITSVMNDDGDNIVGFLL
jgi:hypothetical protein